MKKYLFWLALCGAAYAQPVAPTARLDQLVIPIPQGWYRVEDSSRPDQLVLASDDPAPSQALLLVSKAPTQKRSLEGVLKAEKTYVVTRMDGVLGQTGPATVAHQPAVRLDYSGASTVEQNGRRQFQRTVIQKDDDFYILQAVAPEGGLQQHAATINTVYHDLSWSAEPIEPLGDEPVDLSATEESAGP